MERCINGRRSSQSTSCWGFFTFHFWKIWLLLSLTQLRTHPLWAIIQLDWKGQTKASHHLINISSYSKHDRSAQKWLPRQHSHAEIQFNCPFFKKILSICPPRWPRQLENKSIVSCCSQMQTMQTSEANLQPAAYKDAIMFLCRII